MLYASHFQPPCNRMQPPVQHNAASVQQYTVPVQQNTRGLAAGTKPQGSSLTRTRRSGSAKPRRTDPTSQFFHMILSPNIHFPESISEAPSLLTPQWVPVCFISQCRHASSDTPDHRYPHSLLLKACRGLGVKGVKVLGIRSRSLVSGMKQLGAHCGG